MAKWKALRATFPEEEFEEIEKIKEKYKISYNEIVRSGVKFYVGLTMLKEMFATTSYAREIKIRGKPFSEYLTSSEYQSKMDQKLTDLVKLVAMELLEKGFEFSERTTSLTKERKVGRPKKKSRKVGRPKQYD